MSDDFDLIRANIEEPVRLDDLEAFVHHRGGIDGDAVAHPPVGMRQGLLGRNVGELRERSFAERAAGRGQHQAAHFPARSSAQTLMQRVVLAVHGEKFASGIPRGGHH